MGDSNLGLKMLIGPDEVEVEKRKLNKQFLQLDEPVLVDPVLRKNTVGKESLGKRSEVGGDDIAYAKK